MRFRIYAAITIIAVILVFLYVEGIYPSKTYHFALYEVAVAPSGSGVTIDNYELKRKPMLTEKDIQSYDWDNHTFIFKSRINSIKSKVKRLGNSRKVYVLVADGERIYIGGFYDNGPNIYLSITEDGGKFIYKGVPGYDTRNDNRILKALVSAGLVKQ